MERKKVIHTSVEFPDCATEIYEPMVKATILTPTKYYGNVCEVIKERRGTLLERKYLDGEKVMMDYKLPWQEVVVDFHDTLKSATSGYATLTYEAIEEEVADVVKVQIFINSKPIDVLSFICHKIKAYEMGKKVCQSLKTAIPRQQFEINIQAGIGMKIIAKEKIKPYRKDVLIKSGKVVGGGDNTRKKKLLEKQKEGKKRMKTIGNVTLSQEAFKAVLTR